MNQHATIEEILHGSGSDIPAAAYMDEPEADGFQLCTKMILDDWDYYIPNEAYRIGKRAGHVFLWVNDMVAAMDEDALQLRYVLSAEWNTLPRPVSFRERTPAEDAEARRAAYLDYREAMLPLIIEFLEGDDQTKEIASRPEIEDLSYAAAQSWVDETLQLLYPEAGSFEYHSTAELELSDAL